MAQTAVAVKKKELTGRQKKKIKLVALLLPFMILVAIFAYVPLFGWSYAFVEFSPGKALRDSTFVGLKFFRRIFGNSKDFYLVMRNTLCISFLNICCSVLPAIFAIAISQLRSKRYAKIVQTCTSIPNFISWVLVYSIVFMLLSSEDSALNIILKNLGIITESVNPLANVDHAWAMQVAIGVWKSLGYNAIIYLSAISSIDQELYQAAEVDGANTWQKIIHITVPGLLSTYFVLLLLAISNMLSNGFEQYWLLGNGMTWDKLEVFDTYVYRMGIQNMEYSLATAMGMFKSVISILLLTGANWASKKLRGDSIF
jgi:ABC-type polysaccharide transport system permease subunit